MIMLPLTYFLAALAAVWAYLEIIRDDTTNKWLVTLLSLVFAQEIIIGTRFGYGVEVLRTIQPLPAVMTPAAAYLAFKLPRISPVIWLHAIPTIILCLVYFVFLEAVDTVLATNNMIYAALLIRLGFRGTDALHWVSFSRMRWMTFMLWVVAGLLIVSGVTDAVIAIDFWRSGGQNTRLIAGMATLFALVGCIVVVMMQHRFFSQGKPDLSTIDPSSEAFAMVEKFIKDQSLHLDPDINLSRIARRLVLPTRDVSRAINVHANANVSQYINGLRINHACNLLSRSDKSITEILFQSGFNTKSNFNREFVSVMGQTPSQWRAKAKSA